MELTYEDRIKLTYYLQELTGLDGQINKRNQYYHSGSNGIALEMPYERAQELKNMNNKPEFLYHGYANRSAIKIDDAHAIEIIENNLNRLSTVMRQARKTLRQLRG